MSGSRGQGVPQANRVRIIGGTHRSRVIRFIPRPGLRPTPDRVRETLFNWLGQDLSGRECLDLFAGSGALGLEAASRSARSVVLVDLDREVTGTLSENVRTLAMTNVEVLRADALNFLQTDRRNFDIVFVDPPFDGADYARVLDALRMRTNPEASVYVESPVALDPGPHWSVGRRLRAGNVYAHLLQRL